MMKTSIYSLLMFLRSIMETKYIQNDDRKYKLTRCCYIHFGVTEYESFTSIFLSSKKNYQFILQRTMNQLKQISFNIS